MSARAWRLALTAVTAAVIAGTGTSAALSARHADACRQALAAELGAVSDGFSIYAADPPPCRRYSRAQQRAWLEQDLARQGSGA